MRKSNLTGASWDSAFLTFVKILTTLTSIITTKILSVGLNLSDYGTYSQVGLVISIGTSVLMCGLGDALNYFYNNSQEQIESKKKIVNTIYFIEIVVGIIFVAVIAFGRGLIASYFSNNMLNKLLILVSFKPVLENIMYFYQILFISAGKAKVIAARNLVISLVKISVIYLSVHFFGSIEMIFIAYIILDFLQLIFFKALFSKVCFVINPLKLQYKSMKAILVYSLPMGVYAFTNYLLRDIDKLIIGRMADAETLAIYANCSRVLPFDLITTSYATVLIPLIMRYVSSNNKKDTIVLYSNYMRIGYYSVWTFGAAFLATSQQALTFLYSDKYLPGIEVFIIYIIDSMVRFASIHLILTASGKSRILMWYSLASLAANTVLNILLYKVVGVAGPAFATLIITLVYTVAVLIKTNNTIQTRLSDIFDWKDVVRTLSFLTVTVFTVGYLNRIAITFGLNKYVSMIIAMSIVLCAGIGWNYKQIKKSIENLNSLKL